MAHSAKNLSDKLICFHGAGQDKVCAQKTAGTTKKPMQPPTEITHNKYLYARSYNSSLDLLQQKLLLGTTMVSCWQAAIREIVNILQFFKSFCFCL